ncbi:MAG: M24 family metallopeptidase [bacterium]
MLNRVQDAMAAARIDLLALPPGDDLLYVTGFSPTADERACYLFIASDRALFVVPELNAVQAERHIRQRFLTYSDAAGPTDALAAARDALGSHRRLGIGDTMRADALLLLQRTWPEAEYVPASTVLAPLRMRKSAEEIAALAHAASTADAAVEAGWSALRAGVTEFDVANAAGEAFRRAGAAESMFTTVASGPDSAFPHHHTGTRAAEVGEPVLFDFGSRVGGYWSDITRMAFLGSPSRLYRIVHAVVEDAVTAALGTIRPGVPIGDVDRAARGVIERAGYGVYFTHRTGHGIGLSGHEPPSITHTNEQLLEAGMTFSVEPGIYLPGEFGVRLEEIVVVTDNGVRVLSKLPRDVRIIE